MKKRFSILESVAIGVGALGVGIIGGIVTGIVTASKKSGNSNGHIYHIETTIKPVGTIDMKPLKKKQCKCGKTHGELPAAKK